jgi:hypothetical protein
MNDELRPARGVRSAPLSARPVDELIQSRRAAHKRQAILRSESRKLVVEELEARRNAERIAEGKMGPFLSALSAFPESHRKDDDGTSYVPRGGSVAAANAANIVAGIEGRVNQAAVAGGVRLSAEQAAQFRGADGTFVRDIPAAALDPYLWPRRPGSGAGLVRAVPPALRCSHAALDPCVAILEGKPPDVPVEPPDDGPVVQTTPLKADVPVLIENLVQYTTPPESATIFDGHTRAGLEEVQKGVNGFTLHSGPADAPALHDFHHLQIAFGHVWQELFDDALIQTGKELYTDLVELGVDPNEYLLDPLEAKIKALLPKILKSAVAGSTPTASFDPPASVVRAFDITQQQWGILLDKQVESTTLVTVSQTKDEFFGIPTGDSETKKVISSTTLAEVLEELATEIVRPISEDFFKSENTSWLSAKREDIRSRRRQGERIIAYANQEIAPTDTFDQFHPNLAALAQAMKEPYRFSIYAANNVERSVNFGIVATYRQRWEPVSYQVGELVKTVPLCPKEVRRFTKKVAIRKSRAEKEVENSLQSRKTETSETSRAETTIVQKAQNKTNFRMSAEGGVNVGIAEAKGSTAFTQDAATESEEVKKEFREAVFKAAQEYKSERTTEINVSASEEITVEESGEISNPNDEITVTYLFYELERRYRVSEQIHRITPIVLVAQEFPTPNEIDEDWIVAHDWILRRVLLDDSFVPALNYLASAVVGDEHALREMHKNLEQQRRLAEELQDELVAIRGTTEGRYAAFQKSIAQRAEAVQAEEDAGGIMPMPVGFINDTAEVSVDAARVREEAAKDAYERAMKQEKEVLGRLERETTALNALTETYTKNLSEHLNRKNQISRLRVHLKSNIMYYMQAIWSHEPPDQRFFRLHEVRVPKLQGKATYNLEIDGDATPTPSVSQLLLKVVAKCELDPDLEFQPLSEVADLDNLLGFKGNYMMFPLKKSNALTDFMMVPYVDAAMGVKDPDPLGNWTLTDFVKYVCCLSKKLPAAEFDRMLPGLRATYQRLLNGPKPDGEEIVVPTESLYIEALPGVHPVLEDFKLAHRLLDVKKVQAEMRTAELENVRFVARLLAGEREDPTVEKKVVVEGGTTITTEPV